MLIHSAIFTGRFQYEICSDNLSLFNDKLVLIYCRPLACRENISIAHIRQLGDMIGVH